MTPRYFHNTRAGGVVYILCSLILTMALISLNLFGVTTLPFWLVYAPVIQLLARIWLYGLLVNATHEALRMADNDSIIDDMLAEQQGPEQVQMGSTLTGADRVLDPQNFVSRFRGN
jgi:hypothetical protein